MLCFAGCEGIVTCWFCKLADMAFSISNTCAELEEHILCCSKLGNHFCIWQRQQQNRLNFGCSIEAKAINFFDSLSWLSG